MVSASFQQVSFLGGEWSEDAQGRITDPNFKRALSTCLNSLPKETGAWTRRSGFRFLGITRRGAPGKLFAFDFSTVQPYQIVLTDGFLRMFAGLAPVIADNTDGYSVLDVSTATPAIVLAVGLPVTWADEDTVKFDINSVPCSAPALCGREFTIKSVDTGAGTFALYDPITDAPIDGSTIAWTPPIDGIYNDVVKKVFEIATPYTGTEWQDVRITNNGTQVTFWHPANKPRSLALDTAEPFALAAQEFEDGPYLDLNDTNTTLTPGGTTGSITMIASAAAGINGGDGFKTTDVGRHLRFQSAPAAWDDVTTYAKTDQATGSDGNVYQAVANSTGIDPTTDNGTHWIVAASSATWVWMKITAWTSATQVTCLVQGVDDLSQQSPIKLGNTLSSVSPQKVWQLGTFSDTTGYPSMGCYHGNRLWLANTITANRWDASCTGDFFNFAPTALDGTISDANGFSDEIQTEEVDAVFWMLSTGDGLIIGTQGSEHRVKASVLDDPLSFANQQERRVSKFGSKNIEAILPWGEPVFVQRQSRKLLSLRQVADARYDGDHISRDAQQIAARGIEEIRWQQEPMLTVWARLSDGGLAGCVYRNGSYRYGFDMQDLNYQAFFPVEHAYDRVFDSISTGPSYDGKSNALYAITNQTDADAPDYNVHHVEYLMPPFDDAVEDWGAYFVDGGASPCCGRKFLISNGDTFDGLRLYGLTYLNGLTTSVVIGGLDVGDFAVSGGFIDVPFGAPVEFTEAFFDALSDGTDYGAFESSVSFVQQNAGTAPHPANNVGMYDDEAQTQYNYVVVEVAANTVHKLGSTGGLLSYNGATFEISNTKTAVALNLTPIDTGSVVSISGGYIIGNTQISNHSQKFRVTIADGTRVTYGQNSADTGRSGTNVADGYAMTTSGQIVPVALGGTHLTAHVGNLLGAVKELAFMDVATFLLNRTSVTIIDEDHARICAGPNGDQFASLFVTGAKSFFSSGDTAGLYWWITQTGDDSVLFKLANLAPSDVDPLWTTFGGISAPYYIAANNTFVFGVAATDAVTNKAYIVCYDPAARAIKWKHSFTFTAVPEPAIYGAVKEDYIIYAEPGLNPNFRKISIADGTTLASYTFQSSFLASFGFVPQDGSMFTPDLQCTWGSSDPTFLGSFAIAHGHSPPRDPPAKMFFGALVGPPTNTVYEIPTSIGLAFTSRGQLVPPNAGYDAGARNGPAFGKKRRIHWYAAQVSRTRGLKFGTDFNGPLRPMTLASEGGVIKAAPTLLSDTVTTTLDNDYSFKGQIAWEITRPYPATIAVIGGYIESMDK